jgi:predicted chitinase
MIEFTAYALRQLFPKAPQAVLDNLLANQDVLARAGVNHTRQRLAYCLANVEHETGGFSIPNLTENIRYTAEGAARIWPSRFKSAADVRAKYGTAPGWQLRMFDDVYGNRMGNRPGTNDGSAFIGRGGPQITGRDGYREVGLRCGLDLVSFPESACRPQHQAAVIAGFIDWKRLNAKADLGDFPGYVKIWNGGRIGMADRQAQLAGNDPILARLQNVATIKPVANGLPGSPPTKDPPKEVVNEATKKERAARAGGVAGAGTGGVSKATTEQPTKTFTHTFIEWTAIGVGVAVVVLAVILIARKKALIKSNWF